MTDSKKIKNSPNIRESISLEPIEGLDERIIKFEEDTGELGEVAKDFAKKKARSKSQWAIGVNYEGGKTLDAKQAICEKYGGIENVIFNTNIRKKANEDFVTQIKQSRELQKDILLQEGLNNFFKSKIAKSNYLAEEGMFDAGIKHYLAETEVVGELVKNGVLSNEQAKELSDKLGIEAPPVIINSHASNIKQIDFSKLLLR